MMVLKHVRGHGHGSYKYSNDDLSLKCSIALLLVLLNSWIVDAHLVGEKQYWAELKKMCEYAYNCFHDVVRICGKSVNEERTFLDLCDLYEYSCEYSMVFRHVKDEVGVCPNPKAVGAGFH